MRQLLTLSILLIARSILMAQTGPGGVGDKSGTSQLVVWLVADSISGNDGDAVSAWNDLSGAGNNFTQSNGTFRPILRQNAVNGRKAIEWSKSNDRLVLNPFNDMPTSAITAVVVYRTTDDDAGVLSYAASGAQNNEYLLFDPPQFRTFLDNTDDATGLDVTSANFQSLVHRWRSSDGSNQVIIDNATLFNATHQSGATMTTGGAFAIAGEQDNVDGGYDESQNYDGDIAEVILFDTYLDSAQVLALNNYLAASYGLTIVDDLYAYEANYDGEVAGVLVAGGDTQNSANSSSLFNINTPQDMTEGENLFFGHDNGDIAWTTTENPNGGINTQRIAREWRVDEDGDVGILTIQLDTTELQARPSLAYSRFVLLIDDDGDFTSGAEVRDMTQNGGNPNLFEIDINLTAGQYISFGTIIPTLTFANSVLSDSELNDPNIAVSLNFTPQVDVTFDYETAATNPDVGATADAALPFDANTDYLTIPTTQGTITAGTTSTSFTLDVNQDSDIDNGTTIDEEGDSLRIELSNPSAVDIGFLFDRLVFTINDDDNPRKIYFDEASSTVAEFGGSIDIQVNMTPSQVDGSNPTTVEYLVNTAPVGGSTATGGGTDFTLANGTLVIPAGFISNTFTITIDDDFLDEVDETIIIDLSAPTNGSLSGSEPIQHTVTITDNEDPPTVQFNLASGSGAEDTSPSISVTLSAPSGNDVDVDYVITGTAESAGVDYTFGTSGTTTITAGDLFSTLSPVINDDSEFESAETIIVTLSNPQGATLGTQTVFTYTITDNESNFGFSGPGGIGAADGSSPLELWLIADSISGTNGNTFSSWLDNSGNSIELTSSGAGGGIIDPTYRTILADINDHDYVDFSLGEAVLIEPSFTGIAGEQITVYTVLRDSETGADHLVSPQYELNGDANEFLVFHNTGFGAQIFVDGSNDNATGRSDASIDDDTWQIFSTRWRSSDGRIQYYATGDSLRTANFLAGGVIDPGGTLSLGHEQDGEDNYAQAQQDFDGLMAEVIMFTSFLNESRRIIVDNYLSTKYGIAISNDDYFNEGYVGAAYDNELAGIGRDAEADLHDDGQSGGILRINGASDLGIGEYLLFAHDNAALSFSVGELPTGADSLQRIAREWGLDETGDVGTVDIILTNPAVSLGGIPDNTNGFVLLVDDDGDFSNGGTTATTMTQSGSDYVASGVDIADSYITFATLGLTANFTVLSSSINESGSSINVEVALSNAPTSGSVQVQYNTLVSSTASEGAGQDFEYNASTSSPLTFGIGVATQNIQVDINDDGSTETDETVIIELLSATGATLGTDTLHTLTILDNDALQSGSTGPGGVRQAASFEAWWHADSAVFSDAGTTPSTDGGNIGQWNDLSGSAQNHPASVVSASYAPTYNLSTSLVNGMPAIDFTGSDSLLTVANETGLNVGGGFQAKTVAIAFETGANVTTRQVVYEQGGGTNGINIRVESGQIVAAIWDDNWAGSGGPTNGYYEFTSSTSTNSANVVILEFRGSSQTIQCSINGIEQTPFVIADAAGADLDDHGDDTGIGGIVGSTRVTASTTSTGDYFAGKIMQLLNLNDSLNAAERIIVENYLGAKYDANLAGGNEIYDYASTHPFGVIGIGQVNGEFHVGSTSDSLLSVSNPSALVDDAFLAFGHDNGSLSTFNTLESPDSTIERLSREYRVTKTNDLGAVTITVDTTMLPNPSAGFSSYAILVDADGDFSDGAQVYSMTRAGGDEWEVNVDFSDGDYFTIGVIEPVVFFSVTSANQDEGTTPAELVVSLNYPIADGVIVDFDTTALSTAVDGVDITYPALPSSVLIAAGDNSATIAYTILDDGLVEAVDDTVVTRITGATGALVGLQDSTVLLINDNDNTQEIDFSVTSITASEESGLVNAILRLNAVNMSDSTTVQYEVSVASSAVESEDFTLASGTAQIDAGQLTTSIQIPLIDDASDEEDETIIIQLSAPVNAALGVNTQFTVTLEDDDAAPELNFSAASFGSVESTSLGNFEVAVSEVSGRNIAVDYQVVVVNSTADGSDFVLADGVLNIAPGASSANITATIVDDLDAEVDESLELRLFDNGNLLNATVGVLDTAVYTIEDNDAGGFRGPGGVLEPSAYTIWLRADENVERDSVISALAGNGNIVQRWVDYSTNGNNAKGVTGNEPTFLLNAVNSKPSIDFGSVDETLLIDNQPEINDGNGPFNTRTIVAAFQAGSDVSTQQVVFEEGGGTNGFAIYIENDSVYVAAWAESAMTPWAFDTVGTAISGGQTMIAILEFSVGDGERLTGYFNADSVGTKTGKSEGVPNHGGGVSVGGSDDGWELGSGDMFTGQVMELLLLNNLLSKSERTIVENYLGGKYGANIAPSGNDFFAHEVAHGFEIIGLGRESSSDFHTRSQSDSLITISNASDLADGEYLFVGNDNADISSYITTEVPGTNLERLRREWRITETGDVGTVTIAIDTTILGIAPSSGFTEYVLLRDADGLFSTGASIVPMMQVGDGYQASLDLTDGEFLTFAVIRPEIHFTTTTSNASETVTSGTIEISLNYAIGRDVTVTATETGAGTATETDDFTFDDGPVSITAGSTTVNLPITIVNDAQVENDETVTIQIASPTVGILGSNTTHTYTVNDDDNFRKANFVKSDSTSNEDAVARQIGVFLSARNTTGDTEIFYSVTGGTALNDSVDFYVQAVDTLVFPQAPAGGDSIQFIDINVINDVLDEDPETVIISLTGGSGATLGDTTSFTFTISDDDLPPSVSFVTATRSGAESAQTVDLAIQLSEASGKDIVVPFSSSDITATLNTDFQLPSSSVTILAGNTTDSVQFLVLNDALTEANEQLSIDLGAPTNASLGATSSLTYSILDDDGLGFRGPGGIGNLDEQIAAWFRATDPGFGLSNGDPVSDILDRTNNNNDGFQTTPASQPQYLENVWNGRPVFAFDGSDLIELNNADDINTGGPYDQKTIMVAFRTSADVTTRQMIYEEGGGTRGLSIYIDNGSLYIGGWNNNDDDGGATTPWPAPGPPTNFTVFAQRPVTSNSNNFVFLQFDFLAGSGVVDGDVRASVNGENLVEVVGAGRLFAHGDPIGIGGINGGTVVHDGNEGSVQNYDGNIGELVIQNFVYNPAQYAIVNNYLSTKYNITLPVGGVDDIYAYDVDYSYELFGIGQVNDSSHNDAQGQGIVRLRNPSDLNNDEFMLMGHDNGNNTSWSSTGVPNGDTDNFRILDRTWRVDETGDLGTITLGIQASGLPAPPVGLVANYVLLVDDDDDFSTDATIYQLASNAGYFEVSNLDLPTDAYITFGLANPVVGFTAAAYDGAENATPAIQVGLSYITQELVTVDVDSTINSTAQPADFDFTSNTVTIAVGNQTANVPMTLTNDSDEESAETIELALTNASTGFLSDQDTAVFTILDDDIARLIQFVLTDSTGNEADSPALIRVFADSLSNTDSLRVYYEVIGGTATSGDDFVLAADSLKWGTYLDDPNDTIRTISLAITPDNLNEDTETIQIRLSAPFQAGLGANRDFTYNITDDDPIPSVDWAVTTDSGPESNTSVSAIVSLSAASGRDVTVNYSDQSSDPPTPGGIDYDLQGTSIIIPAGATQDTIPFSVFDDAIAGEGSENVIIRIDGATNASAPGTSTFTYTILDDDGGFGPLGPGGVGDEDEIAFWLRADSAVYSDLGTTLATNGNDVRQWDDQGGNGNNAFDGTVLAAVDSVPSYEATVAGANNQPGLNFDDTSFEFLTMTNDNLINLATNYTQKTMAVVFETGDTDPPSNNQMIYEQGGGGNGFNIYHGTDGDLHFAAWSTNASPAWNYTEVTAAVGADQLVMAIFEIDAATGDLNVYIDGSTVSTTSTGVNSVLNAHGGLVGIGATINDTRLSAATTVTGNGTFFDGRLFELTEYNERNLNLPARRILRNYFSTKYGISIGGQDVYAHDGTYGNELFGIGAQGGEIHIESKGSGILRLDNPQSIDDGDYLLIGHDDGAVDAYSTTNTPPEFGNQFMERVARTWRLDETGDFGEVRVSVDTTEIPTFSSGFSEIFLMLGTDPNFATYDTLIRFSETFGSELRATFDFADDQYFTLALVQNVTAQDGPWDEPTTWTIGVPAANETAFLKDSVYLRGDITANTVVALDNMAGRGKLNLQSHTLNILDSLIILGYGLPAQDSTTFTASTGTVNYGGPGTEIFIQPLVYYNLTLSGQGRRHLRSETLVCNNFTIDDNPELVLDGNDLHIQGDWSSAVNATFSPGGATVVFNGNGPQNIIPTNSRVTFDNLVINNSGGNVILGDSVEVLSTLTLTQNNIELGNELLIISNTAPGAIVGPGDNSSYIIADGSGAVRWSVAAGNSYTYPVGDASGDYSPLIVAPSAITGSSPSVDVRVTDARYADIDDGRAHISRYWTVEPTNIATVTFDVTMEYTDADVSGDEADLVPIKFSVDADTSDFPSFSLNTVNNTLLWQGLTSFSAMGAGVMMGVTTPVELLYFEGENDGDHNILVWATATEINNEGFEIEWSADGEQFENIGFMQGNGTSNEIHEYQFVDREPWAGINYYRLRQIDYDGVYDYSNTISIEYEPFGSLFEATVFPNPAPANNININIETGNLAQPVEIRIVDLIGRSIYAERLEVYETASQHRLQTRDLKAGAYILLLSQDGSDQLVKRLVIRQ